MLKSKTGFNKPRHYVDNRNTVCVYIYKNINMDSLESESDCMAHNLVLATDGDFFFKATLPSCVKVNLISKLLHTEYNLEKDRPRRGQEES